MLNGVVFTSLQSSFSSLMLWFFGDVVCFLVYCFVLFFKSEEDFVMSSFSFLFCTGITCLQNKMCNFRKNSFLIS